MPRAVRSLLLLTVVLAATGAALPEPPGEQPTPSEVIEGNAKLLAEWKADPNHAAHVARLQRDLERFWSLPAEERGRLRAVDKELHELDSETQKRLWGVLERYHTWLERLPEADRKRIDSARGAERLAVVKEVREQQFIKRLPPPIRNRVEGLRGKEREDEIARLREEQRQRSQDVFRLQPPRVPKKDRPARLNEFPFEVQLFVRDSLLPLLTQDERDDLKKTESQPWPAYARKLVKLSAEHPIPLPGPVGPVRVADLPNPLANHLKGMSKKERLKMDEGKWPEFGVALLAMPQTKRFPLPARLTPAFPSQFPEPVQEFIKQLDRKLTSEEREKLQAAEGQWPEYPQVLLELARKHRMEIPGMSLPGPKELWNNARAALPEVPERTLMHFVMTEMNRENRDRVSSELSDPAVREKVRKEYFRKHPRELKRLQQLDVRGPFLNGILD
jgi:hypothetical protein